jgi:hypothetical protein
MNTRILNFAAVVLAGLLALGIVAYAFFDPYDRHASIVGFVMFGIWSLMIIGGFLLQGSPIRIGFLTALVVGVSYAGWRISAPSNRRLEIAEPTIHALNRYHESHGSFPRDLTSVRVHPAKTRFGAWRYEPEADGQQFRLEIGDYGQDLFRGSYSSANASWCWDN